ncbi:hypothetical protein FE257_007358 [Aspergillus nanangensis]|uniref:Uncharacterized protein n=1 Tax=Aspergillus nanangensis TaxID=2582783 RepID=A0AAD4CN10_ASPNN|nr:hypothetical protein FE257_007358 [Aspergillus nanangensis]
MKGLIFFVASLAIGPGVLAAPDSETAAMKDYRPVTSTMIVTYNPTVKGYLVSLIAGNREIGFTVAPNGTPTAAGPGQLENFKQASLYLVRVCRGAHVQAPSLVLPTPTDGLLGLEKPNQA